MLSFHPDQGSLSTQIVHQGLSTLYGQSLLNLRFLGIDLYCSGQLGQACYPTIRHIGDVNFPVKWQEVVLTHGMKENILLHYHIIVNDFKRLSQMLLSSLAQPSKDFLVHFSNALWRLLQTFAASVFSNRLNNLGNSCFNFLRVHIYSYVHFYFLIIDLTEKDAQQSLTCDSQGLIF